MFTLRTALLGLGLTILVILAAGVGILSYRFLGKQTPRTQAARKPTPAIISGSILYNSRQPLPANDGYGKIVIYQRLLGDDSFTVIPITVPLVTASTWAWSEAESGKTYELVAVVEVQGQDVSRSHSIVVTAPAGGEQLVFDGEDNTLSNEWSYLANGPIATPQLSAPQYLTSPSPSPIPTPTPTPSPSPSFLPSPTPVSSPVVSPSPAGVRAAIIGSIDLNGPVANNSSILILQRKPGTTTYTSVARIPAADGQMWSFDSAIMNTEYEVTAALQVNNNNTSTANAVTVIAPASGTIFKINTNVSLNAPAKPRLVSCSNRSADTWTAELVFDQVENANSYWLQIGTALGKFDTYDEKRKRTKSNEEKASVGLTHGKKYYVRYAQAQCSDCRNDQDYSSFSESLEVTCQ